jgi:hypothetical protein
MHAKVRWAVGSDDRTVKRWEVKGGQESNPAGAAASPTCSRERPR